MTRTDVIFARQFSTSIIGSASRTLLCAPRFCFHQGILRHQVADVAQTHRGVKDDLAGFGQSNSVQVFVNLLEYR
ncbi:hypothetical protein [Deinococcus sp. QL22]|uniref:hypothetical protein n=1 Tax=Deinococcus sp. QL22 TaxID=2939437 RepID=UPI002017B666|nr:hypothetical protein [Deinococcus sp. QL22]UQN10754.1 hypothetical protein M1R55_31465 [Deinococcus sp. QL22]UQN10800.1 hypothetical protein M1R55_31215 [Deinococcus sp. QL22]